MALNLDALTFDDDGLIPAVLQDWLDGTVLMVAYMNRAAVEKTIETGHAHFWSRSRRELWEKGATSGNYQRVREVFFDCDNDTVLVKVSPAGPACHTGRWSCFFSKVRRDDGVPDQTTRMSDGVGGGIFERIYDVIARRKAERPEGSYVASLMQGGQDRILKKIAEEAGEVILGAKNGDRQEIISETADLVFHLLIVLGYHDIALKEVYQELGNRFGVSGRSGNASAPGDKRG